MENLSHTIQIQLDISQPGFYIKVQQGIYVLSIFLQTTECEGEEENIESKPEFPPPKHFDNTQLGSKKNTDQML